MKLLLVTTTYPHAEQRTKLQHCLRRIKNAVDHGWVERWIIVEDAQERTPAVAALLRRSKTPYIHLAIGPSRAKGHVQRGLAYETIRDLRLRGIVYNLDDDNEYDPRLWSALRELRPGRVGVLAVQLGLRGVRERQVERPLYDRATGRFGGFQAGWCYGDGFLSQTYGPRRFCIDMGGFAFDAALIHERAGGPPWSFNGSFDRSDASVRTWRGGESEFLATLITFPEELQPLLNCGLDVLVYHNGLRTHWRQSERKPFRGLVQRPMAACKLDGW